MDSNVWENADALAMAVRLHVARKAPEEIENLLGLAVMDIVRMATKILLKTKPNYRVFADTMFSHDVQSELVFLVFRAIENGKVATGKPRAMLNLFVKISQNRIRNLFRNRVTRLRKANIVCESELSNDGMSVVRDRTCDIFGNLILNNITQKKEVSQWQRK